MSTYVLYRPTEATCIPRTTRPGFLNPSASWNGGRAKTGPVPPPVAPRAKEYLGRSYPRSKCGFLQRQVRFRDVSLLNLQHPRPRPTPSDRQLRSLVQGKPDIMILCPRRLEFAFQVEYISTGLPNTRAFLEYTDPRKKKTRSIRKCHRNETPEFQHN